MMDELKTLRELTETITVSGYLRDHTVEWEYALDAIPDCIYIINDKFEIKFVNTALAKRLKMKKEDCIDKICYTLIKNLSENEVAEFWADICTVKAYPVLEERYLKNINGWFNIVRSPIITTYGTFIGFICVLQEVTKTKIMLQELQTRETTLTNIFDFAPLGIGLFSKSSKVIKAVNKTILNMTGYSKKELIGKSIRFLYPTNEEFEKVCSYDIFSKEINTVWLTKTGKQINVCIHTNNLIGVDDLVFYCN